MRVRGGFWLSVVRAPIAPQATRSAMYCGVGHVEEFVAAGRPRLLTAESTLRAILSPLSIEVEAAVQIGIVDQAFPADRRARLLEIDAHHDLQPIRQALAQRAQTAGIVHGGDRSWIEQGPTTTSSRSSVPFKIAWIALA